MDDERKDDIQELYDKSDKITKITDILLITNILISLIIIFQFKYRDVLIISDIILSIIYVTLSNINEIYFKNLAENERRKSLIKESFNINTTVKETSKYYNNDEKPSIEKLGLNCYESAYFTKNVVDKMIFGNIIKVSILLIIYLILMIKIEDMDFLLIITQTLFSAEFAFQFIKLCYYKFQLDKICKEFENICFMLGIDYKDSKVLLLDATMDYECLKTYCKIATSSKIFFDNNEKWSKQWQKMLGKVKRHKKK